MVTATQVPATSWEWCSMKSPVGSLTAEMPSEDRSKQPTSSTGPKRFFMARSMRKRELRSPSKLRTTSTRCSSTRGPAIEPSLVTWPTMTVVMLRVLATRIRAAATSLTWVTPPGTPSMPDAPIVWMESTTNSVGRTSSMCVRTAPRSVSAARNSSSCTPPVRSARIRTWAADSSPVT